MDRFPSFCLECLTIVANSEYNHYYLSSVGLVAGASLMAGFENREEN